MKDFLSLDVESVLLNDGVYAVLVDKFPSFSWRRGDSDAQGPYVSGRNDAGVTIKCWTGESPMAMSISFRGVECKCEEEKELLVNVVLAGVIPKIGRLVRADL